MGVKTYSPKVAYYIENFNGTSFSSIEHHNRMLLFIFFFYFLDTTGPILGAKIFGASFFH